MVEQKQLKVNGRFSPRPMFLPECVLSESACNIARISFAIHGGPLKAISRAQPTNENGIVAAKVHI